jgi:hypothetical protein
MYENTRVCVFIHCFLVFGCPGETLALVVHILHPNLELLELLEMMDFSPASEYVSPVEYTKNIHVYRSDPGQ